MTGPTDDFPGPQASLRPGQKRVAILLYSGFDLVDLVGSEHALKQVLGVQVHLVAAHLRPVASATALAISPTTTREDCPAALDGLVVPGGEAVAVMQDPTWSGWLAARGPGIRRLIALGHGALLLGQAGLLHDRLVSGQGLKRDLLTAFGATPLNVPIVRDTRLTTTSGSGAGAAFELAWNDLLRDGEHTRPDAGRLRLSVLRSRWPVRPSGHPQPAGRGDKP